MICLGNFPSCIWEDSSVTASREKSTGSYLVVFSQYLLYTFAEFSSLSSVIHTWTDESLLSLIVISMKEKFGNILEEGREGRHALSGSRRFDHHHSLWGSRKFWMMSSQESCRWWGLQGLNAGPQVPIICFKILWLESSSSCLRKKIYKGTPELWSNQVFKLTMDSWNIFCDGQESDDHGHQVLKWPSISYNLFLKSWGTWMEKYSDTISTSWRRSCRGVFSELSC